MVHKVKFNDPQKGEFTVIFPCRHCVQCDFAKNYLELVGASKTCVKCRFNLKENKGKPTAQKPVHAPVGAM